MIKDALTFKKKITLKIDKEYKMHKRKLSIFPITEKEVVYLTQEPR